MQWYYTHNGVQGGPIGEEELHALVAAGKLEPADFVWNESMGQNWQPAASVPGLLGAAAAVHPPDLPLVRSPSSGTHVSCTMPVGEAWQWMLDILFRPFQLGKWFVLGLASMFAYTGQGSANMNFSSGGWNQAGSSALPSELRDWNAKDLVEPVRDFIQQHHDLLVTCAIGGVLLFLVLWLVGLWLQSRMKFVFIDNVVQNTAEIKLPWRTFAQHGNSLFRWNVCYDLVRSVVALLLLVVTVLLVVIPVIRAHALVASAVGGIVASGGLWLAFAILSGYINRFREDMVIPLMYKLDLTAMEAWREFGQQIWAGHRGALLVYGLFWTLLALGAQICVGIFALITCGIGCCCLMIPYISSVVILPVPVFLRAYSLAYLGQFGERYALDGE